MTDTARERAQARAALTAPVAAPDVRLLTEVRRGLQAVPAEHTRGWDADDDAPRLAVRRRATG